MHRSTILLATFLTLCAAGAGACPGNPDALGTARTLALDTRGGLKVGTKSYPATLALADREIVLTFDDGPWPGTTPAVLDALARECVKATFFLIGQNAEARPALVRRMLAEGHTVAHHTWSHPILNRIPLPEALAEIDRGIAAVEAAGHGGAAGGGPRVPFFRFPGFGDSPALLDHLARRNIGVFGADLWASDWNLMTPAEQFALVWRRLEESRRGLVLFHDTKQQTAAMIPDFLRALKRAGYRVVHIVPAR